MIIYLGKNDCRFMYIYMQMERSIDDYVHKWMD